MRGHTGAVTTIMHDTADLDRVAAFWTRVLGLGIAYQDDRYVYLDQLSPNGPRLAFQLVPESKSTKNRLHLDLQVPDRSAFVELVETLGGSVLVADHREGEFPPWTVLADPEGNEFCVYEAPEPPTP
ncbi:MAG: VOC family protein [Acidimicrobiia bacterium]